jgi:DNA-binding CsgD family transcriptional regulator
MQIKERREDVLVLLIKGMRGYEIAKELEVNASTVSRDIQYLISQSHTYLNSLAKEAAISAPKDCFIPISLFVCSISDGTTSRLLGVHSSVC